MVHFLILILLIFWLDKHFMSIIFLSLNILGYLFSIIEHALKLGKWFSAIRVISTHSALFGLEVII